MKKLSILAAFLLLPLCAERAAQKLTITSGTPMRLATVPTQADRILIIANPAASGGVVYVMTGVPPGTTPSTSTWPTVPLCAGTSTAPGCAYADQGTNIDLSRIWVDGAHTGDTVTVTYETK